MFAFYIYTNYMSNIFHNIFGGSEGKILAHVRGTSLPGEGGEEGKGSWSSNSLFFQGYSYVELYFCPFFPGNSSANDEVAVTQKFHRKKSAVVQMIKITCQNMWNKFCSVERYEALYV